MLDSYIIDRIRREREQRERSQQVPLRIERQPPPVPPNLEEGREAPSSSPPHGMPRGSVVIDFQL